MVVISRRGERFPDASLPLMLILTPPRYFRLNSASHPSSTLQGTLVWLPGAMHRVDRREMFSLPAGPAKQNDWRTTHLYQTSRYGATIQGRLDL